MPAAFEMCIRDRPRGIWPLPKEKIGDKGADGPNQKSGLGPQAHGGNNDNCSNRLYLRKQIKRGSARNSDGTEHRQCHQFPGARLAALKKNEERDQGGTEHQKTDKIIILVAKG